MRWSRQGGAAHPPRASLIFVAIVLGACASSASPPSIASGPLPSGVARTLTAEDLAADAVDRDALLSVLDDAGFGGARELVGADRAAGVHRVAVRTFTFHDDGGGGAYLAWLEAHMSDVIGEADAVGSIDRDDADEVIGIFRHEPGDCCPKATVTYLTAWRDGNVVVTLELAGPSVEPHDVAAAASRVVLGSPS